MRTTLDLPEELLNEAMRLSNIKTKTRVIVTALEDLIRKNQISKLKQFQGNTQDVGAFDSRAPQMLGQEDWVAWCVSVVPTALGQRPRKLSSGFSRN